MDFSNLEKLLFQGKLQFPKKLRWFLTIGVFAMWLNCMGQRENVWLLLNNQANNDEPDSIYCMDFNYCPPAYKKLYLEKDIYLKKMHNIKYGLYSPFLKNSFCDTSGKMAFTELLGQHYYNNKGILYDSTYLENSYFKYANCLYGLFLTTNNRTYYFKTFLRINSIPVLGEPTNPDSFFVCVSEFSNNGDLITKNRVIYKDKFTGSKYEITNPDYISGRLLNSQNAEITFTSNSRRDNTVLNYDFNTGDVKFKKSLAIDSIGHLRYSTSRNKIMVTSLDYKNFLVYERDINGNYKEIFTINASMYPTTPNGYNVLQIVDYCLSPNDSVFYITLAYSKDTTVGSIPPDDYLFAFKYSNGFGTYKFIQLQNGRDPASSGYGYYLKLGPDGNMYIGNDGPTYSKYRIKKPNSFENFKIEKMPDIKTKKYPNRRNYSLWISTLEDYKKTEFIWQPTCDSLKVRFTNTCDTQYFKRYRLFFGNADSVDLNKNWNTTIYNYPNMGKYFVKLKAFSKIGGFIWYGDSIEINNPPVAKFGISQTKGCQWIGYTFDDSSKYNIIKPGFKPYKYWTFGDGNDSLDAGNNPKLTYTYTTSNTFTVKLIVNNGYCTDTAIKLNNVVILPAPKPGITAAPLMGCTPLKVNFSNKYADVLDSAVWRNGEAASPSYKGTSGNFIYNQVGNFWLSQKLYGPSGCITQDSVLIKVYPGISGMPDILTATVVNENDIYIKWKKHLNAINYSIIKNNTFLTQTPDTSYTDKKANTLIPNSYTIKAISICNDSSKIDDIAQTIYLQANRNDNNEAQLNWTAYQRWDAGVNTYSLFSQNEAGVFELMTTFNNQTMDYLDKEFAGISEAQRCYKIIADEKDGNLQQSGSNVFCLPLKPVLLIPSAFSPNGDGVNDIWKIDYKGIKEAQIKIFNRWGEVIYIYTAEKPEWDGRYKGIFVPPGAYFYHIEATGIKTGKVYKNGVVEVVR